MFGLGSSSSLGIGIAIRLHDQFSAQAQRINNQLTAMNKNAHSALSGAVTSYRNQSAAIAGGAALVAGGMYSLAEQGARFGHVINQVAIVGGPQLKRTRAELTGLAEGLSRTFVETPENIAITMAENVRAGVGKGLDEITKYQIATATATDEMLQGPEGVGAKLLGIMNSMGLKATDIYEVAGKRMSQFARIANATTAASNATMASVYSIGESMEYFSNTASLAGLSLEQALTLVGKLSQANIRGSAAGTALNNMIQQMINATSPLAGPKKGKAFGMLGIDPNTVREMVNQGRTMEALEYIDAQSRGAKRGDRLGLLNQIFNMRGSRGIVNAFMGGEKSLASIRKDIEAGVVNDVAMKQSKAMANDLFGEMKLLTNAFHRFRNAFALSLGPTIRVILNIMGKGLEVLSYLVSTPVGKVLAGLAGIGVGLIAVLFAFRTAALTATIALRGFAATRALGGFSGLLSGGLGMVGNAAMGPLAGKVRTNAAGRLIVKAGETVRFGGKVLKGGNPIPAAAMGALGGAGARAIAGKASGFFGAATGFFGKAGSMFGKILPVVGWVITAVEILDIIKDIMYKDSDKNKYVDPLTKEYYNILRATNSPWLRTMDAVTLMKPKSKKDEGLNLNQNIQLNLDGNQVFNQGLKAIYAREQMKELDNKFNFQMPEIH